MDAQNSERSARGRPFRPGESGNPGGRPKADPATKEILLEGGQSAARFMVALVQDKSARNGERLRAAEYVLDRLLGKSVQPILTEARRDEESMTLGEMMAALRELLVE